VTGIANYFIMPVISLFLNILQVF